MSREERDEEETDAEGRVLSVHVGHSANCSSVGSFVDFLFVSSVVGAAAISAFAILVKQRADEARRDDAPSEPEPDDEARRE